MIPKVIHYCWFGRNPKPEMAYKCLKSWDRYCRDYEIIEWNEDNFSINDAPQYVQQAYKEGKWAFVTDYVRLWAMTKYGGIYMDTDVEVLKPLDRFLEEKAFSGFEATERIPTGIMACEKGFPMFLELLEQYNSISFYNADGSVNLETNVTKITRACVDKGLRLDGTFQRIEGFALFPVDYFCPLDFETKKISKTDNTHTIHWFNASWWSEEQRKEAVRIKKLQKKYKIKDYFIHAPNRVLISVLGIERYEHLKALLKRK